MSMYLPICENQVSAGSHYLPADETYQEFYIDRQDETNLCAFIRGLVGADCWALTLGQMVVYNYYGDEHIDGYLGFSRDSVIDNPNTVVEYIRSGGIDTYIDIYMFRNHPWKVRLSYTATTQIYNCAVFN